MYNIQAGVLRGRHTRMCCVVSVLLFYGLTHVRHRQNAFTQSEYRTRSILVLEK